jgi:hypothetical protein
MPKKVKHDSYRKLPTKYDSSGHIGKEWSVSDDDGYSSICPKCAERHSPYPELVGKERYLDPRFCSKAECINAKESHFYTYYQRPVFT